jgi:hypothetical protein
MLRSLPKHMYSLWVAACTNTPMVCIVGVIHGLSIYRKKLVEIVGNI